MTPNTDTQEVKLVHGIRGGIPNERMEQIHAGLPRSLELKKLHPYLETEDPFIAFGSGHTKAHAQVRLSQGWHLLNEARFALVEADACKVFYEECEPNLIEAIYWRRFYFDDAVLRLCSSCEHLLQCVNFHWNLGVPPKSIGLGKVITAAAKSTVPEVNGAVATSLRGLTTEWKDCKTYRNDWVHNERPGVAGLGWEISFNKQSIPPQMAEVLKVLKKSGYPPTTGSLKSIGFGKGREIGDLDRIVRTAFCQLFGAYEGVTPLLA
jgi:Cthe_2314-like HEPN